VHVGQQGNMKKHGVHEALITGRSEFFARALNGKWIESDDAIVALPYDNPETFALYIQLLYNNMIPLQEPVSIYVDEAQQVKKTDEALKQEVVAAVNQELDSLCELYVFCEKMQDPTSKKLVVKAMVEHTNKERPDTSRYYPGANCIETVYQGTVSGDPMRKFLVDCYVWRGKEDWFKAADCDHFHPKFLYDFAIRMRQVVDGKTYTYKRRRYLDAADYLKREDQEKD
jgi:hypothetical protein